MASRVKHEEVIRFADMLSAMGSEPRLRIMRLLLSAHPDGLVVGEIGAPLERGLDRRRIAYLIVGGDVAELRRVRRRPHRCVRGLRRGLPRGVRWRGGIRRGLRS